MNHIHENHQLTFIMDVNEPLTIVQMMHLKLIECDPQWDKDYHNDLEEGVKTDRLQLQLLQNRRQYQVTYRMEPRRKPSQFVRCSLEIDRKVIEAEEVALKWMLQQEDLIDAFFNA